MNTEENRIIAIPGTAPSLEAPMESKFGRAALLLLVDPGTLEFETLRNPAREASGGAGIEAAELLSRNGVQGLIAEKLGPKAEAALAAAGITFYECEATGTVRDAIERLKAGELLGPSVAESAPDPGERPGGEVQAEPENAPEGGRGEGAGRGRGGGGGRGMGGGGGMGGGRGRGRGWGNSTMGEGQGRGQE